MDEELEQRGVTPESFFDQATETREMVQTVQKTSNSNLSLLNELKERVRKIEIKLFDEEDKRQKEEMEAKVKEQNEKSQGEGGGSKEGEEEGGGTKGGGGGVMGFVSSFIGGLVGGTVGLAIQGAGAMIGLGAGVIKKGADLGKNLAKGFSNLFGGKKNKKGGELKPKVNPNSLMDLKVDDEDKNVRGTGAKNRGREGGNFSGDQQRNERGEYAFKNKKEVVKEESFSIPEGKKTSFSEALSGDRDTIHQFLFEQRIKSVPPGESFNDFSGNPAYDSDVDTFLRGLKDSPQGYGIEIDRGRVYLSKEKAVDGGYTFGRDTKYEGVKSDNEMYGDTFPKRSFSGSKKNTYERAILEFNEGGVVQKFNQGGEVDTVPAMLTPGEFVVSKDAVKKVGVDTLKGLNASVGATNKPSFLGSIGTDDEGNLKKFMKFGDRTESELTSSDGSFTMRNVTDMSGGGLDETTTTSYNKTFTEEDGTVTTFEEKKIMRDRISSIGVPDLIEHKDQLLGEIHKLKGFENVTIDQVITSTTGIPKDKLLDILLKSDAQKATSEKEDKAFKEDLKARGIKPGQGFNISANDEIGRSLAGTMGYRMGQINPDTLVTSTTSFLEKSKSTSGVKPKSDPLLSDLSASINASVKGYNQGGLVGSSITPIIESKNESGEMELINNLSQSVDTNRQTLMVMEEQNQEFNAPNQNPNPVALADTPQTAPTELQDTEAPIPFASLLRQSAQKYLNLGNNAMVIS